MGYAGFSAKKNSRAPVPFAGGGGTAEAARLNGRKRRSCGEDRSWGELSVASEFLQSIVARHALAEKLRLQTSAAAVGFRPPHRGLRKMSRASIALAAKSVVRKTSNASRGQGTMA